MSHIPVQKVLAVLAAAALAGALAGCSSSPSTDRPAPSAAVQALPPAPPDTTDLAVLSAEAVDEPLPDTALMARASVWTPRYVQTGLASGIMVEFTGMKKGKTLKARYANIELRRYTGDSADARRPLPAVSGPMRAQTTINDLHQAFFKIQPGRYFFRITNPWADRAMLRDLEVKDGAYAVLSNDVYAAWLRKMKVPADSSAVKP